MSRSTLNGTLGQSNSLEDLRDVLDEIPSLNESANPVHSGSPSYSPRGDGDGQLRSAVPPNSFPSDIQWQASVLPANSTIPLSSPSPSLNGENGRMHLSKGSNVSKIDFLKQWSISTYKCTRQALSEKLGKVRNRGTRTVDLELETQIDQLRETQKRLSNILRLARALSSHFYHVVQTQTQLAESFSDLASKSPDLQEEFTYNAETQKNLSKNGETLLGALNFFVSSLNTLCNKTMEDTLLTIKQYEIARLEFDAYRTDLEEMMQGNRGDSMSSKLDDARKNFALQKDKYERLRSDVSVKMKFLEENKVKVMHKQLLLFHNAISAYFSGNQVMLEATLKQFNIKLKNPNSSGPSWLEQ